MITFQTDDNNDLFLNSSNSIAMCQDGDAVLQVVKNVVRCQKGELQLDINKGVPYLETIFNKQSGDIKLWESFMIAEAESVNNVKRVRSMTSSVSDNVLNYTMEIESNFGNVVLNG